MKRLVLFLLAEAIHIFSQDNHDDRSGPITASLYCNFSSFSQASDPSFLNSALTAGRPQFGCCSNPNVLAACDSLCRQKFGACMGYNAVENMMNRNNHDFMEQLLSSQYAFSDDQIVALSAEYFARGRVKKKHRKEYEQKIQAELKRRQQQRDLAVRQQQVYLLQQEAERKAYQEKLQKLEIEKQWSARQFTQKEFVQQQLQKLGLDPEQCIYLPKNFELLSQEYQCCVDLCHEVLQQNQSPLWQQRLQALQKTINQNFAQSQQDIEWSAQVQGYLISSGLCPEQYRSCFGTQLQQQLHSQIGQTFECIADKQRCLLHKSLFLDLATECNDASFWANSFESVHGAICLQDLAVACCDLGAWTVDQALMYSQAACQGIVESVHDFVNMVRHPVEMVSHLGQALWFACDTIALCDEDALGGSMPVAAQQRQERFEMIHNVVVLLQGSIANSTGPQRVQMATKFAADCIFQHKALQTIGAVVGVFRAGAGSMRTAEYVADILGHEAEFALASEIVDSVLPAAEDIMQNVLQEELIQASEAASLQGVGQAAESCLSEIRSLEEVLQDIAACGNKIPLSNVALCEEVMALVKKLLQEANVAIDANLRKQFSSKWILENGIKKQINLDIEHIINYSCEFIEDELEGVLKINFKGGHFPGNTEVLAKQGLIKNVNKKIFANGCCEYKFTDAFTRKSFSKTEFPAHWDYKKLAQSCFEVYENPESLLSDVGGKKVSKILLINDVQTKIIIKLHDKCANIITAYPIVP